MCRCKRRKIKSILFLMAVLTLPLTLIVFSYGQSMSITVSTSKEVYGIGDKAQMWGNVTYGEYLVFDAVVAIQIDNPSKTPVVLRTKTTGTQPSTSEIEILSMISCDFGGNPKGTFKKGTIACFLITVENQGTSAKYAEITLNIFDARNVVFEALVVYKGLLYQGTTDLLTQSPIPLDISSGNATAYINAFSALPSKGGYAYCLEKSATFTAVDGTPQVPPSQEQQVQGIYNLTFLMDNYGATRMFPIGIYNVTVTCKYTTEMPSASKTFELVLKGDINRDGIVDIYDAILMSSAFNSNIGDHNWNPNADLNGDNKVDIFDAIILASNFGKTA